MRRNILIIMVVPLSLVGNTRWVSAADPDKGKTYFEACQSCHGVRGEGTPAAPRLGGQPMWYTVHQLQNFRSDMRGNHESDVNGQLMRSMARLLPDDQAAQDVAAYLARQETPPPARTESSGRPQQGKTVYSGCQACHGQLGQGNASVGGPRLAGQHDWYLIMQLQNFRSGLRGVHEQDTYGRTMRLMAQTLLPDEQAIKDVAAYIATLP
ncbi:MAG: c-type cytochrome [Acidiferrobacterales bacterium]|nr:c-type cytochrome [Acidiferrobacterales bacterium]